MANPFVILLREDHSDGEVAIDRVKIEVIQSKLVLLFKNRVRSKLRIYESIL